MRQEINTERQKPNPSIDSKQTKKLTMADFFCGAGGFTEGFRQAGIFSVYALDIWTPAVETYKLNHPYCTEVVKEDIRYFNTIEKIKKIPDVDIIIGSPPCVAFSRSNKSGNGDKKLGVELIESLLKIIAVKKRFGGLKYWIVENVPNAKKYLKKAYTWSDFNLDVRDYDIEPDEIALEIDFKKMQILNSAEFMVPQRRFRLFFGEFPDISKYKNDEDNNPLTIEYIFNSLGPPLGQKPRMIKDPNYERLKIEASLLTDHYYDSRVDRYEWEKAKRLKIDHGYMGKMDFPERKNRLSRTVMATASTSSRESMLFEVEDREGEYRLPTIREIACFMSFPITYQFKAKTLTSKYRLVGNAVCPKISNAIAKAILENEGYEIKESEFQITTIDDAYNLNGYQRPPKRTTRKKRFSTKFSMHIPNLKINGFRVELSNKESDFTNRRIIWKAILHHGSGKKYRKETEVSQEILERIICDVPKFTEFKRYLKQKFNRRSLSSIELQTNYIENNKDSNPMKILEEIKESLDRYFPDIKEVFNNKERAIKIEKDTIPMKILLGLYACNLFVNQLATDDKKT